jgi:hypothetical protein
MSTFPVVSTSEANVLTTGLAEVTITTPSNTSLLDFEDTEQLPLPGNAQKKRKLVPDHVATDMDYQTSLHGGHDSSASTTCLIPDRRLATASRQHPDVVKGMSKPSKDSGTPKPGKTKFLSCYYCITLVTLSNFICNFFHCYLLYCDYTFYDFPSLSFSLNTCYTPLFTSHNNTFICCGIVPLLLLIQ